MKKYLAIGHFKDSENMVSVAEQTNSVKAFKDDLRGNGFVAYAVITESRMDKLRTADTDGIFEEVKKMTSNFRVWLDVTDYIEQCFDIIESKIANAQ